MGRLTSSAALVLAVGFVLLVALRADRSTPGSPSAAVEPAAAGAASRGHATNRAGGSQEPVRAAYFYNYMPPGHVDSIAARGFNRAVIHWITDSLGTRGTTELRRFQERGEARGVDVVPQWALQARERLKALPTARRYTWGDGRVEPEIGCPADSIFWHSTLLDRAMEAMAAVPATRRLAVDLEIYFGGRHHYDAGACQCTACVAEYVGGPPSAGTDPRRLRGMMAFQEARITQLLEGFLEAFAAAHPGVVIGVFDLDLDVFVHRSVARAFARAGHPVENYTERSYALAGARLPGVRARMDALGLEEAPVIGGLWLKQFRPEDIPPAAQSVLDASDGYFVFTTFSLWKDPASLRGPYRLMGEPADYWRAFEAVNRP